jgi:septal ring factor EnvC (AmiA/AmiB activator)
MRWLNHKKLLWCAFALLLFCLLLPSCFPPVAYAEKTYQITEAELTTLEQNLATLEAHSKSKEESYSKLKKRLETAEKQLMSLQESNKTTQSLLANAEESLNRYAKEQAHKRAVEKRQRTTWAVIACIATAWAVCK